jgi:hypothetical protein
LAGTATAQRKAIVGDPADHRDDRIESAGIMDVIDTSGSSVALPLRTLYPAAV